MATRGNKLHLDITDEQQRTLELEVHRLADQGIKTTKSGIVRLLIEHHRLNLRLVAEQDDAPDVLAWLWRKKNGEAE